MYFKVDLINLDALSIITKNNSNEVCTTNILMIIWSLQKISNSQKCGPTMICAFVDLLGHFATVSLLYNCTNLTFFRLFIYILYL